MAKDPTVSVLMPVYNAERYLREAVDSVLGQTFTDFELIAVDDGSTDGSLAMLREYERRDGRVKVISRPNTGIVGALNDGLAECRGELIARMDADDVCLPERFAKQVAFLREHPEVVAVSGVIEVMDAHGVVYMRKVLPGGHEEICAALLDGDGQALVHPALMVRKSVLQAVGGYDPKANYVEDWELYLRLMDVGRLANLPEVVLRYRIHGGSTSATKAATQKALMNTLLREQYVRRGMSPPETFKRLENGDDSPRTTFSKVTWMALSMGNVSGARRSALRWVRTEPLSGQAWKALLCTLRGY